MSCFKRILGAPVIIFLVLLFGYFTYFLTTFFGFDFRIIIGLFILSFFLPFLFKYSEIAFGFFLTASFFKADLRLLSIFPAFFNLTILDKPVLGNRQHYLRWKMPDTWRVLERASLKYDTTLGFADHEGFCYGICYPYRSFDILGNRVFAICIWEVSLIAMEGGVFSYQSLSLGEGLKKIQTLIDTVERYRGVFVTLWHNRSFYELENPRAFEVYKQMLDYIGNKNMLCNTVEKVFANWIKEGINK